MPNEYVAASSKQTTNVKNTQIRLSIIKESIEKFSKK